MSFGVGEIISLAALITSLAASGAGIASSSQQNSYAQRKKEEEEDFKRRQEKYINQTKNEREKDARRGAISKAINSTATRGAKRGPFEPRYQSGLTPPSDAMGNLQKILTGVSSVGNYASNSGLGDSLQKRFNSGGFNKSPMLKGDGQYSNPYVEYDVL